MTTSAHTPRHVEAARKHFPRAWASRHDAARMVVTDRGAVMFVPSGRQCVQALVRMMRSF